MNALPVLESSTGARNKKKATVKYDEIGSWVYPTISKVSFLVRKNIRK